MQENIPNLSRKELDSLTDEKRKFALEEMNPRLTLRILKASDFNNEVENIITEFHALGHDLRLFDADFDTNREWQIWCGDWTKNNSTKLILHFDSMIGVESEWSITT